MQEVFEKIKERMEGVKGIAFITLANTGDKTRDIVYDEVMIYLNTAIEIVNQVAEEYAHRNCMHCKYESLPITDEHCEYCMHQYSDDNFEPKEYSNSEIPNMSENLTSSDDLCEWFKYDYRTIAPKNHDVDNPYWRIPEDMSKLRFCPYCGKEIKVV